MSENQEIQDIELIQRCRDGDEVAFGIVYNRYRRQLFAYILKVLDQRRELSEDIFQQVWLKAVTHWNTYDDRQRLLAWLCRIAHNLIMDVFRRDAHMKTEELADWDGPTEAASRAEAIDRANLERAMEAAILQLPQDQRAVLEARRNGKSFKEIADEQNSSINTVLGRMHYAVNKLKTALREYI